MAAGWTIRAFDEADGIAELTALLHAAYAIRKAQGFNYTAVDQSEDVTRERLQGGECYVAQQSGALIGTVTLRGQATGCAWYESGRVGVVHQFAVLPRCQNQGLGAALMLFAEERARALGCDELALDTSEGAADLVQWYEKRGYRAVDHAQWPGKTYRSIVLSKRLAP